MASGRKERSGGKTEIEIGIQKGIGEGKSWRKLVFERNQKEGKT